MEVREQVRTDDPVSGTSTLRETSGEVSTPAQSTAKKADKINQVVWLVIGFVNALLLIRIVFYLLGAHSTGFASGIYSLTYPLAAPFTGIFAAPQASGSYFDSPAVVAIIVYSLLGYALTAIVTVITKPAPTQD